MVSNRLVVAAPGFDIGLYWDYNPLKYSPQKTVAIVTFNPLYLRLIKQMTV